MSTAVASAATDSQSESHAVGGRLVIREPAVRKTAAYVASSLSGVNAARSPLLSGLGLGAFSREQPQVEVEISGDVTNITVHLALPYPAPLRQLSEEARETVQEQVQRLTGLRVGWVDIRIDQLKFDDEDGDLQ